VTGIANGTERRAAAGHPSPANPLLAGRGGGSCCHPSAMTANLIPDLTAAGREIFRTGEPRCCLPPQGSRTALPRDAMRLSIHGLQKIRPCHAIYGPI